MKEDRIYHEMPNLENREQYYGTIERQPHPLCRQPDSTLKIPTLKTSFFPNISWVVKETYFLFWTVTWL